MSEEQIKAGKFRVALWGFKKADVLAYIDVLAAENLQKEAEHTARAEELQASIDALNSDKETLLVKTKEICQQLTSQEKRTNEAQAEAQELLGRLTHLQETAESYKSRLFTQEQELETLRTENTQISQMLEQERTHSVQAAEKAKSQDDLCKQLQEKLDQEIAKAQQAMQKAAAQEARCRTLEQNLKQTTQQTAQRLNKMREQAQADVLRARQQGLCNVQKMSEGMQNIRVKVEQVESRLTQAMQQMNETAQDLYTALDQVQQGMQKLDSQLKSAAGQPVHNSYTKTPPLNHQAESQQPVRNTAQQPNKRTLVDNLLERVSRLLSDE